MKICVFGATGQTGQVVVAEALTRGIEVVAPVRSPEKLVEKLAGLELEQKQREQLRVIKADLSELNQPELLEQLAACQQVVIALGSRDLWGNRVRSEGTRQILEAVKASGAQPHIQAISAAGCGDSQSQLSLFNRLIAGTLLKSVMDEHNRQEQLIAESGLPYTILRPTALTNREGGGGFVLVSEGKLPGSQIARSEIARCILTQSEQLVNQAICITAA